MATKEEIVIGEHPPTWRDFLNGNVIPTRKGLKALKAQKIKIEINDKQERKTKWQP